jgi:hypothetical protein
VARGERGQAAVEWSALALVVALVLGALGYIASRAHALRLGREVVEAIFCVASGGCLGSLEEAYGRELAEVVTRYAPNIVYERSSAQLPIDFRRCRKVDCSNGSSSPREIAYSSAGLPVTAFTRVVDRRKTGDALYLQYWLYFPESFSGGLGRRLGPLAHKWPGYHPDDWEGYQVRIASNGTASVRATAHGHYKNFKHSAGWGPWTGWYRVSGGSHAGHVVRSPDGERTTPARDLELVPLERLSGTQRYRFAVAPPWLKPVYLYPELEGS